MGVVHDVAAIAGEAEVGEVQTVRLARAEVEVGETDLLDKRLVGPGRPPEDSHDDRGVVHHEVAPDSVRRSDSGFLLQDEATAVVVEL